MRSRTLWTLVKAVVVLHLLLALAAWFNLPPRIPTHFGANGRADAWNSTSIPAWFGLWAVSLGLSLMIYFLTALGNKKLWNIAEKKRFLQLTPAQQAPVLELMRLFGAASALCVNVVFLTVHLGMYLAANGHTNGLPWWINLILFGAPICLVLGIIPWNQAVRREILQASSSSVG